MSSQLRLRQRNIYAQLDSRYRIFGKRRSDRITTCALAVQPHLWAHSENPRRALRREAYRVWKRRKAGSLMIWLWLAGIVIEILVRWWLDNRDPDADQQLWNLHRQALQESLSWCP